ncbi:hypothetical protein GH733_009723 [Mirounga leonina]|nr:hypothetical protein GH733_009723 [Mirounga leonina]
MWPQGLEVEDVEFVISYDYPNSSEDYIHRIGRAAYNRGSGCSRGGGGLKDDHWDRYSLGKRAGFNTFRDRENYDRGYSSLLKRDLGGETQNGICCAAIYTSQSFGSNFVSAGLETTFRTEVKNSEEQYNKIVIPNEESVIIYYKIRQQLAKLGKEIEEYIHKPKYCLPFLQPGRLVKVKNEGDDFGWGVVVNFSKKSNVKVNHCP